MGVAGDVGGSHCLGEPFKKVETLGESWDVKRWDVNVETTVRQLRETTRKFPWKWWMEMMSF